MTIKHTPAPATIHVCYDILLDDSLYGSELQIDAINAICEWGESMGVDIDDVYEITADGSMSAVETADWIFKQIYG